MSTITITYDVLSTAECWLGRVTRCDTLKEADAVIAMLRRQPETYRNIHATSMTGATSSAPATVPAEILATLRTVLTSVRAYDATVVAADPFIGPDGGDYAMLLRMLAPLFELIGDAAPGSAAPETAVCANCGTTVPLADIITIGDRDTARDFGVEIGGEVCKSCYGEG